MKQVRILEHHADLPAKMPRVEPPEIDAIDSDRSPAHVIEARDQVHDRRLPTTRRANEPDQLAGRDVETHAPQHLPDAVVAERHVVERDAPVHRLEPHRLRHIADLRLGVEHFEYPVRRRRRAIDRARHLADDIDRRQEHRRVKQKRDEGSHRQMCPTAEQPWHCEYPDRDRHRMDAEDE